MVFFSSVIFVFFFSYFTLLFLLVLIIKINSAITSRTEQLLTTNSLRLCFCHLMNTNKDETRVKDTLEHCDCNLSRSVPNVLWQSFLHKAQCVHNLGPTSIHQMSVHNDKTHILGLICLQNNTDMLAKSQIQS